MASWFNKWLFVSIAPLSFYINGSLFEHNRQVEVAKEVAELIQITSNRLTSQSKTHPIHVSVTEINHNTSEKTLEITLKIFRDDFEKVLADKYKTRVDLINPTDRKAMEKLVADYVSKHLVIKADGKQLQPSLLGFEFEDEAIFSYLQVENLAMLKNIGFTNSILYDLYDDQISIIHVTTGNGRKSGKLNYPDKELSFQF